MGHETCRVVAFEKVAPFTLRVRFDDNTSQVIDFQPVLKGDLYSPLRDSSVFNQVHIDREVHTLVWPNGADFDPGMLHDWPESGEALKRLAENSTSPHPSTHRASD